MTIFRTKQGRAGFAPVPRYVQVMENASVIGATGGIGRAVVADLQARGVAVTTLGRVDGLDVTEPGSVDRVLGAVAGPFDLIFVAMFNGWAEGRKQLRMEYFYRDMRRLTGLLIKDDQPAGGQWNYDHDNRKSAK